MTRRWILVSGVALLALASLVGAGVAVGRKTAHSRSIVSAPDATPETSSVRFSPNRNLPGRLVLTRTDCSGDDTSVGWFSWTREPGTEEQPYHIAITPWDGLWYLSFRDAVEGKARLGGFATGKAYTITVTAPGSGNVWAAGDLSAASCRDYSGRCPPSADLMAQGPVTGAVSDTTARIWVRTCYSADVVIEYKAASSPWSASSRTAPKPVDETRDNTLVEELRDLSPLTEYDYRVLVEGIAPDQPPGHFATLPHPGTPSKFRFLSTADTHQIRVQNRPDIAAALFSSMAAQRAQFQLLIGDNIDVDGYGSFDPTSAEAYRRHYRDNWSFPALRGLMAGAATFEMWDDHDIMNDWAQKQEPPYGFARQAYEDFINSRNPAPLEPGSTYYSFDAGDGSFFVLDDRSFRDAKTLADDANKTMLGQTQKEHLKKWLKTSTAQFKFIVSTVPWNDHQVLPLKQYDGWDGFRTERQEIFDYVHQNHVGGVMLISADNHWPMVTRQAYGIPEFQTTPAVVTPGTAPTSGSSSVVGAPDVLFYDSSKNAYGEFDIDTTVTPAQMNFRMMDETGSAMFSLSLTAGDLAQ